MINNSLKEYYINLTKLYNNTLGMAEALNQSLSSNSSSVTVTLDTEDGKKTISIPSLLYIENKLESLENNFNNLFNMPSSGEAWFSNSGDMFKLQMVRSTTAPSTPELNTDNVYASITDNNFLKDLVSPKTFLKINIPKLPDNIEKVFMRKIIFSNYDTFKQIKNLNIKTYDEYSAALYNLNNGIDYEMYDSNIELPIKSEAYASEFRIGSIIDSSTNDDSKTIYTIKISNTLQYHNQEDSTIEYTLKENDLICLGDELAIYKVKFVDLNDMTITIEEVMGHISLQPYEENSSMVFRYYVENYNKYHYVNVPLEENQYIAVFIGLIYNGTRSLLSDAYLVDLGTIYMYDKFGSPILDPNGNQYTYIEYYNKFCTNIGDIMLGLTKSIYPQISNFTNDIIYSLENNDNIKTLVNSSFMEDGILQVVPINKHLIDDITSEDIINLHTQKSQINSQLLSVQENINNIYTKLVNTDFSQEINITQESLRSQLNKYYTERTTLQKQLNAIIDNINSLSTDITIARENTKYRVRGITETVELENYIHSLADEKVEIIGIDCEYKYKSPTKDTTSVMNINSNIFTDWIKLDNIERGRKLVFNPTLSSFSLEFEDYSSTQNIIKWNQIDIPIVQGEDVVLRLRYKYNIGQPFIDLYTPWSEEMTIVFPTEFNDNVQLSDILKQNDNDVVSAKFSQTLINDGYQDHVNNSIISNGAVFYHMPENIYSGFNTPENNMVSLKDKLNSMSNDIENTKTILDSEVNRKFDVYITYDSNTTKLFGNTLNKINIYNADHITDSFVKKSLNIVIRNTGTSNVKLYSIFPGNIDIPLLLCGNQFYEQYIRHYERVPIFIDNVLSYQTLGQWIYFRQDNPYTYKDVYYNNESQNLQDYKSLLTTKERLTFTSINTYMKRDYDSPLLGYRKRNTGEIKNFIQTTWIGLDYKGEGVFNQLSETLSAEGDLSEQYRDKNIDFFIYENNLSNNYLNRFEDISGINKQGNTIYLDRESSISEFIAKNSVNGVNPGTATFTGAFLFPDIEGRSSILTSGGNNDYIEIEVGKSISIPITFEFYIDGETTSKITKAIYFDLRDSLINEPVHYMIELTANYDYTSTGSLINSTTMLIDDASNS